MLELPTLRVVGVDDTYHFSFTDFSNKTALEEFVFVHQWPTIMEVTVGKLRALIRQHLRPPSEMEYGKSKNTKILVLVNNSKSEDQF